jgi:hypothetical protein
MKLNAPCALVLMAVAAAGPCAAQGGSAEKTGSPEWLVQRFLARDSFPDRARYYTGEMKSYAREPTLGSTLPGAVRVSFRALERGPGEAVFAAHLNDGTHAQDWYLYLVRGGEVWKLQAVRTLMLPPLFYTMLDSTAAGPDAPDSLAARVQEMRLMASSDSALKEYFAAHAREMDALAALIASKPSLRLATGDGRVEPAGAGVGEIRHALRALHIGAASRDDVEAPGCVLLTIGGIADNEVGYVHAPPGCKVPQMSPERFIYVERVAPGWYLYKTT